MTKPFWQQHEGDFGSEHFAEDIYTCRICYEEDIRNLERRRIVEILTGRQFFWKESGGDGLAGLLFAFGVQDDFTPKDLADAEKIVIDAIMEEDK